MRPGGGKAKGAAFERGICKLLSLWVSGGALEDLFWRSAMSGGRATVAHRKGINVRQGGDICSVSPEGHSLTDNFYIECKHLKKISLDSLIKGVGPLIKIWRDTRKAAKRHDKTPMLIFRQNGWPTLACLKNDWEQALLPHLTLNEAGALKTDLEPLVSCPRYNIQIFLFAEMLQQEYDLDHAVHR